MRIHASLPLASAVLLALVACAPTARAPTATFVATTATAPTAPYVPPTPTVLPPTATAIPPTGTPAPSLTLTPAGLNATTLRANMDALMNPFMREEDVVGCSVVLVYPNASSGTLQRAYFNYGTLARGSDKPVDSTTIFEIGSVTKLFTADLLALYVRAGKMKLDDPLQKYLPANVHIPTYNGQAITLLELATHTSALPRRIETEPEVRKIGGVEVWGYASEDEIFRFLDGYRLTRAPGSQWEYSNLGFALLAIAEQRVGNSSYEDLVRSKIATALGMNDTRIVLSAAQQPRLAQGYSNGKNAPPVAGSGATLGAGAFRSTTQDLAAYLIANITPDNSPLGTAFMASQQPQNVVGPTLKIAPGLAWNIANPGTAQEEFDKDGATAGYNAYIAFSKSDHNGFAALCNGQNLPRIVPGLQRLVGSTGTPVIQDQ